MDIRLFLRLCKVILCDNCRKLAGGGDLEGVRLDGPPSRDRRRDSQRQKRWDLERGSAIHQNILRELIGVINLTSVTPENSQGINCAILMGPMVHLGIFRVHGEK